MKSAKQALVVYFTVLLSVYNEGSGIDANEELSDPNEEFKNSPMVSYVAVSGGKSVFPCNIISPLPNDSVQLVLWYKDYVATPIFSYDVRASRFSPPKIWADPVILSSRAHFSDKTTPATLVLNSTSKSDQAVYRCRVDYKVHTTTHSRVNLTVIEPVKEVRILDDSGTEIMGAAGPYLIGSRPTLTCKALGGDPLPLVNWWRNGQMLDHNYHQRGTSRVSGSLSSVSEVINAIHLDEIRKDDLRATYTCKAQNHDLSPVLEASAQIDLNFGPETVEMKGMESPLSSGKRTQVMCEARGSRPPAILSWWLDGTLMKSTSHTTSLDGLISTSTLELTLGSQDEGKRLTCRAVNPEIPSATLEHSETLHVLYPPIVSIQPGPSLDLSNIKEGDDVYFDCKLKAQPETSKVSWGFNGISIKQNVSSGIMTVGHSLVLQKVSRNQAGKYLCSAANSEGTGTSSEIELFVQYAPVCRVEQTDVYGVGRLEKTTVTCRVDADPPATSYRWAFNHTGEFVDIPLSHFAVKSDKELGQRSDLRYSPVSELDYGTLLCWATNAVGTQKVPCTFTVFPAGKPDPLASCKAFNETEESLRVTCKPGFSGGMNQTFFIEAWDEGSLRATEGNDGPILEVTGLKPGIRYTLRVFAENSMGRSLPYTLTAYTLTDVAERRTAIGKNKTNEGSLGPLVGAIVGACAVILLLLIIGIFVARCRKVQINHNIKNKCNNKKDSQQNEGIMNTEDQIPRERSGPAELERKFLEKRKQECDLIATSQESLRISHSQDSTTPLLTHNMPSLPDRSILKQRDSPTRLLKTTEAPRRLKNYSNSMFRQPKQQQVEVYPFPSSYETEEWSPVALLPQDSRHFSTSLVAAPPPSGYAFNGSSYLISPPSLPPPHISKGSSPSRSSQLLPALHSGQSVLQLETAMRLHSQHESTV